MQFLEIQFENANRIQTDAIVNDLTQAGIGYEHGTGRPGHIIGGINERLDYETFVDKAMNIVHDHNDGMWCEVSKSTEDAIEDKFSY
jgi:hypothetical protein